MFEKFTERARKVLTLSRQQAQRLNSEFIGTEHLLLGLLDEGGGVAAALLKRLEVDPKLLRMEIEKLIPQKTVSTVTLSSLPFSPRAKVVLDTAWEEAVKAKETVIGTEHLLCALFVVDEDSIAWQAMRNVGLEIDCLRSVSAQLKAEAENPVLQKDPWIANGVPYVSCKNCGIVYCAEAVFTDPQELRDLWKKKFGESVRGRMCRVCSCPDYRPLHVIGL